MAETAAVKIQMYNHIDLVLWFAMSDSTSDIATPKPITDPAIKFNYCVAHLLPETASLVRDIVLQECTDESYQELKAAILKHRGESRTQEIMKLLDGGTTLRLKVIRTFTSDAETGRKS